MNARPFSESEFARREPATLLGIDLTIVSLEDLILSKLEWASLGGSARQLEDVRSLLRIHAATVDRSYVERWVSSLGIERAWSLVRTALDDIPT